MHRCQAISRIIDSLAQIPSAMRNSQLNKDSCSFTLDS